MISRLVRPPAVRRATSSTVGWWSRMRTTTVRWRAAFACRCPPRWRRCRPVVIPDEAGIGQAPHSFAKAASERIGALVHDSKLTVNDPNPEASHRPLLYDSGRLSSVTWFRT